MQSIRVSSLLDLAPFVIYILHHAGVSDVNSLDVSKKEPDSLVVLCIGYGAQDSPYIAVEFCPRW